MVRPIRSLVARLCALTLIAACGGAEELAEILGGTGLGDDAWLIRTLAAIAELDPKHGGGR